MISRFRSCGCALTLMVAGLAGCQQQQTQRANGIPLLAGMGKERATRLDDRQAADVQIAMARSLEASGDLAKAQAAYENGLKRDPHRADAMLRIAILQDRQGHFKDSSRYYEQALRESKGDAEVHCNYGYSLYLQRRWADAEAHLRQAIAAKPDYIQAHNNLGLLFAHTERADEGLAEFRRAGCTDAQARANLAFAYTVEGQWDAARVQYQQALAVDPRLDAARSGLKNLDSLVAMSEQRRAPAVTQAALPVKPISQ